MQIEERHFLQYLLLGKKLLLLFLLISKAQDIRVCRHSELYQTSFLILGEKT
jgi:hypothetical protein